MKRELFLAAAAMLAFSSLTGCQSMEEMRAERAKRGEQAERLTGSNLPRRDGVSDVKIASGEALRTIENANAAATATAGGSGR